MNQISMEEKLKRAAGVICKQGMVQFQVSQTAIDIIEATVGKNAEELDLIYAFRQQPSQTMDQLLASSGLSEEKIQQLTASLAQKGLLFNQPNSAGVMVYRILPLMLVGLMEYKFMVELTGSQEEKRLAELFEKLLAELRNQVQDNYDTLLPLFKSAPAADRTVPNRVTEDGQSIKIIPVGKALTDVEEVVIPSQTVEEIINKFDDIAVGYCFCRQRRSLLGDPCSIAAPTLNCFTFGKSARHTVAQGFAKKVSKQEAMEIMQAAEKAGLIHKAFHPGSRESSPETSICNCCKDCCDTLELWRNGTLPMINSTFYLSVIDPEACTGCGICVERCPTDAISLNEAGWAQREESACLGCGVCSRFCPEEAIALKEGLRKVFIMPPRLRKA
ncbi:MAG: 4Fe-4S binding protein [Desulfobacterales bacterium]|jgi:Na+-translocating ferredoxin:NAD+ oxidoreductase RNF subunit RnfB